VRFRSPLEFLDKLAVIYGGVIRGHTFCNRIDKNQFVFTKTLDSSLVPRIGRHRTAE
jgi:hypothetical protein